VWENGHGGGTTARAPGNLTFFRVARERGEEDAGQLIVGYLSILFDFEQETDKVLVDVEPQVTKQKQSTFAWYAKSTVRDRRRGGERLVRKGLVNAVFQRPFWWVFVHVSPI
jgi:hypothetical protein